MLIYNPPPFSTTTTTSVTTTPAVLCSGSRHDTNFNICLSASSIGYFAAPSCVFPTILYSEHSHNRILAAERWLAFKVAEWFFFSSWKRFTHSIRCSLQAAANDLHSGSRSCLKKEKAIVSHHGYMVKMCFFQKYFEVDSAELTEVLLLSTVLFAWLIVNFKSNDFRCDLYTLTWSCVFKVIWNSLFSKEVKCYIFLKSL